MAGDRPSRGCLHGRHRSGLAVERREVETVEQRLDRDAEAALAADMDRRVGGTPRERVKSLPWAEAPRGSLSSRGP